ncbi:MAG: hypothetical protein V7K53_01540 [Nostoc sp.]|uniref:hypothetical protein n=1 Tax=Nostoc sp. TaxID=1180 RepID=UPI002FFAF15F
MSTTGCPVSLLPPSPDLPSQHPITSSHVLHLTKELKIADAVYASGSTWGCL